MPIISCLQTNWIPTASDIGAATQEDLAALNAKKQNRLFGRPGEIVGFDQNMNPVAQKAGPSQEDLDNVIAACSGEWTEVPQNIGFSPFGITYGDGKFVAIGANRSAYSTDGFNWVDSTGFGLTPTQYVDIAYGDGTFIVADIGSSILYSKGGITWPIVNLPMSSGSSLGGLAYGNGKFIVIAIFVGKAFYSPDAINWTETNFPFSARSMMVRAAYGNGKFVVVDCSSGKTAYSTDGISWTEGSNLTGSLGWTGIAYGNKRFVAIDYGGDVAYSDDGISWEHMGLPSDNRYNGIAYGNGHFVVLNTEISQALISTDGVTWATETISDNGVGCNFITYGNGKFIAVDNYGVAYYKIDDRVTMDQVNEVITRLLSEIHF